VQINIAIAQYKKFKAILSASSLKLLLFGRERILIIFDKNNEKTGKTHPFAKAKMQPM
jgi:hypothetical protein